MFNDINGALTHFNGVEAIIKRRGGLQCFKSNPVLRTVIFWYGLHLKFTFVTKEYRVDVNAAFLQDNVPRFPIPYDILPRVYGDEAVAVSESKLLQACTTNGMISAVYDLLSLNQFMVNRVELGDLWDNAVFAGLYIAPLLSKLLSVRHDDFRTILAKEESCRIGALLYLSGIRRRFGLALISDLHVQNLKNAILEDNSSTINPILTWLLVIGGSQSVHLEDREWFVSTTTTLLLGQYSTWRELMAAMKDVLWVEGILEVECDKFHMDVINEAWSKYGHLLT